MSNLRGGGDGATGGGLEALSETRASLEGKRKAAVESLGEGAGNGVGVGADGKKEAKASRKKWVVKV